MLVVVVVVVVAVVVVVVVTLVVVLVLVLVLVLVVVVVVVGGGGVSSRTSLRELAWSIRTSSCGPAREGTPPNGVGWHLRTGQSRARPGRTGLAAGSMV